MQPYRQAHQILIELLFVTFMFFIILDEEKLSLARSGCSWIRLMLFPNSGMMPLLFFVGISIVLRRSLSPFLKFISAMCTVMDNLLHRHFSVCVCMCVCYFILILNSFCFWSFLQSPLYNFISEQKLDVSEVDRDKVSGQASAEIGPPRSFNPNYRGQHANNSVQGSPRAELKEADINVNNLTSDPHNLNNPESNVEDAQLMNNVSQPQLSSALDNQSFIDVHCEKDDCGHDAQANLESKQNAVDVCKVETGSAFHVQGDELGENPSNGDVSVNLSDETHKYFTAVSKNSEKDVTDIRYDLPCEEIPLVDMSSQHEVSISSASANLDPEVQTKLENMSLTEPEFDEAIPEGGNIAENDTAFLSALHNTGDGFASDFASVPPNDMSTASTDRIEEELSPGLDSEIVGVKRSTYDPSQWTPMEIETATGNGECTLLEHPLKLKSTYTEVEDCSGTRDPNGEPLVTSYNRCFFGTVDYIWRSEGLQTVRVLAPIPKHAMQWTSGFPTRKWGSDHIALATELVFMKCSDRSAV